MGWLVRRREIARAYDAVLLDTDCGLPTPVAHSVPAYHLYVLRMNDRAGFRNHLTECGIQTGVHYPVPASRIKTGVTAISGGVLESLPDLIRGAENAVLSLALVGVQIVFVTLLALLLNRIGLRRLARTGKAQG